MIGWSVLLCVFVCAVSNVFLIVVGRMEGQRLEDRMEAMSKILAEISTKVCDIKVEVGAIHITLGSIYSSSSEIESSNGEIVNCLKTGMMSVKVMETRWDPPQQTKP